MTQPGDPPTEPPGEPPPAQAGQPPAQAEQPPAHVEQPPPLAEQPPAQAYQPPTQAEQSPSPAAYPPPAPPPPGVYGYGQQPLGAAPPGMYFDQISGLTLPQGTQLAEPGRRIGAFFLGILLSIVTLGIGYVIWGAIVWARGQTPALQVLGMRCWRPETGRVPGWWWMALREIIGRLAESILSVITLLLSLILMLSTRERKSLHDLVAGTVVLYDPDKVLASPSAQSMAGAQTLA